MKKIILSFAAVAALAMIIAPMAAVQASNRELPMVSSGYFHSVAIQQDGSLWAWGDNHIGQLGDGTTSFRNSPVHILDDVVALANGFALRRDGSLWAWSYNLRGLHDDESTANHYSPVSVMDNVIAISTHWWSHSMAVRGDGSLWAWGQTHHGDFGIGYSPTRIMFLD